MVTIQLTQHHAPPGRLGKYQCSSWTWCGRWSRQQRGMYNPVHAQPRLLSYTSHRQRSDSDSIKFRRTRVGRGRFSTPFPLSPVSQPVDKQQVQRISPDVSDIACSSPGLCSPQPPAHPLACRHSEKPDGSLHGPPLPANPSQSPKGRFTLRRADAATLLVFFRDRRENLDTGAGYRSSGDHSAVC